MSISGARDGPLFSASPTTVLRWNQTRNPNDPRLRTGKSLRSRPLSRRRKAIESHRKACSCSTRGREAPTLDPLLDLFVQLLDPQV